MTDRSVRIRLEANITAYSAAMAKATKDTKELKTSVTKMATDGDKGFQTLATGSLVAGSAMALGFGKMMTTAAGFEKQMSGVRAASSATGDQMKQLSEAAIEAGASQQLAGVTASDAARAEAELAKAGVSVADTLNGALMGSLSLASAGQLDFAKAAEISAQAMNIFDLRGSQVGHVADVLAAAANKSATDVGQLGDAMKQGGLVAAQTGLSFEETTAALAMFSDNALVGSDAGTSLKTMLQRLTPQSAEARDLMEELGFSAYDAQGNFIGLEGLAGELQTSLAGMTTEQQNATMATLFGSDAVRAANILYTEGAKGVEEYTTAVNDQGAAARMAAIQNDNLSGDVEALGGALESAFIENGSKATGALRGLTQTATAAVGGFSALPEPVQTTAMALGGVATAGSLTLGVLGTMGPKLGDARKSLDKMGASGQALNRNLGSIAGGMAVLGAGMAVWGAWETMMADARAEADKWGEIWHASAMSSAADGLGAFKAKLVDVRREQERLNDKAASSSAIWDAEYRESLRRASENLGNTASEIEKVTRVADEMARGFDISGDAALEFVLQQQSAGVDVLSDDWRSVADSMGQTWVQTREGTVASQELGGAMETLGSEVASVEEQVAAFEEALDTLYGAMFGVEDAADALQSSMNELPDLLKEAREEGLNLNDVLTSQSDAAIGVREQMRGMVEEAIELITQWREQGITGDELRAKIDVLSEAFRQQAEKAGLPVPVVDHYLGLLAQIPIDKTTDITAITHTDAAETSLEQLSRDRTARITAIVLGGGAQRSNKSLTDIILGNQAGGVYSYASGGFGAMTPAHIANPTTIYKYAEPATGGEAFVPKNGDRGRALGVLSTAAGWHGAALMPMDRMTPVARGGSSSVTNAPNNSRSSTIHMHYHGISEPVEMGVTRAARKAEAVMG